MKKFLSLVIFTVMAAQSFAQDTLGKRMSFSIGAEIATPLNAYKDHNSFGLGISALAEYRFSKRLSTTLNAGYIFYDGKTAEYKYPTIKQVPVLVGVRYYFTRNVYLSGQGGISWFNGGGIAPTYAPGLGVRFGKLDATLKYMGSKFNGVTFSNVSVRIAFKF